MKIKYVISEINSNLLIKSNHRQFMLLLKMASPLTSYYKMSMVLARLVLISINNFSFLYKIFLLASRNTEWCKLFYSEISFILRHLLRGVVLRCSVKSKNNPTCEKIQTDVDKQSLNVLKKILATCTRWILCQNKQEMSCDIRISITRWFALFIISAVKKKKKILGHYNSAEICSWRDMVFIKIRNFCRSVKHRTRSRLHLIDILANDDHKSRTNHVIHLQHVRQKSDNSDYKFVSYIINFEVKSGDNFDILKNIFKYSIL